jgi:hypothetical protein
LNFGDLGSSIKDYVEQYQSKTKSNANLESIEDMKRFIEDFPEFRKLSGNVSKHVTLVGELSRKVGAHNLLDVSELEQSLACTDNHATDLKVRTFTRRMKYTNRSPDITITYTISPSHTRKQTASCVTLLSTLREASFERPASVTRAIIYSWRTFTAKDPTGVEAVSIS